MKIITFKDGQGSKEWHEWRRMGIGASDIAIINRSNPYKTPLQLWEEKCGYREQDEMNAAMKHGHESEILARQWINNHLGLNLKPVCIEDIQNSVFRASLDGYDFDNDVLVEIKSPVSDKILDRFKNEQAFPDYWFDQMQWQIAMCNDSKKAYLGVWDYRTNSCMLMDMFGHVDKIKKLRDKGTKFWHMVKVGRAPEPEKGDYIKVTGDGLEEYLAEYMRLCKTKREIEDSQKVIKEKIVSYGDDGNFMAYGYKVQRVAPRVSYDIELMRKDGIDVDQYIKKNDSIGFYRIFPPKK